jgi:hypothetical protein
MAAFYDHISPKLQEFIAEQHIYFVASAPNEGHINLSPKGMNSFRCLDANTVAYLDLTGSGNETSAHLAQNGRLTIMFCSFTEKPLILRLYGTGRAVRPRDEQWSALYAPFVEKAGELAGVRQIIVMNVEKVQTSCGFGVPYYELKGERSTLVDYWQKQGTEGLAEYWHKKNTTSMDGLPTYLLEAEPH